MDVHLETLNWYPDESDTTVLADFVVRRENGEPHDLKFRVIEADMPPTVGIRVVPTSGYDPSMQMVLSDHHGLVLFPSETWALLKQQDQHERMMNWLPLVVAAKFIEGRLITGMGE